MAKPVRFGVTLPQIKRSWQEARDTAIELDALGYDSLWVCDHVYGVPAPNLPIFEAWSELAAVAAITQQAKLGTLVTPPFFRNPAILAKQIATIDHVAGGGPRDRRPRRRLVPARVRGHGLALPEHARAAARARGDGVVILKGLWTQERFILRGPTLPREGRGLRAEAAAAPGDPDRRRRRAGADGHRGAPRGHLEQHGGVPGAARRRRSRRCGAAATR